MGKVRKESDPKMATTLVSGQTWKELPHWSNCKKGGTEFKIGGGPCGDGCGKNKDICACICAPSICLCHTVVPCFKCGGDQCYYGWACANGTAGVGLTVYDGGKKMKMEWCCINCGEFEKVSDAPAGSPPVGQEMQR